MREDGKPIGTVSGNMRKERVNWYLTHDSYTDPICKKNCLDVCHDYNLTHYENRNIMHLLKEAV